MNNILDVCIGRTKSQIKYKTEENKKTILDTAKIVNEDFNKLIMKYRNVDDTLLLFFYLIKIEIEIEKKSENRNSIDIHGTLDKIINFINVNNPEIIKQKLIIGIIAKKMELDKLNGENVEDYESVVNKKIEDFCERIIGNIKSIEDIT